ncbi:MAG: aminofutalosine synthase MqnE [Planctomycetota bacterium]|nr:aminofutalosine synthase MqnE [Planctomycetota bacterium]
MIPSVFRGSPIRDLLDKSVAGERLTLEDGVRLFETDDLHALGWVANHVREARHGDTTYYLKNRHINYSNVCKYDCMFCSFYRSSIDQEGAWEWSVEQVLLHVAPYKDSGLREFHIVGGVHPHLPFSYYTDMLRALKEAHPGVALKAFTAIEIAYFAELTGKSLREVLTELKHAGLQMLPGGGAEVFADRVRYKVCRDKADADRWFEVHETAHALGIPTNATLLYGHIETTEERVDHILRLRDLQDRTSGLKSYIPLAYHPDGNRLQKLGAPTGVDALRNIAVGRLLLDNVAHIKAYWIMLGIKTAQLALSWGANDIDGTVTWERIYHMAGSQTPEGMTEERLREVIEEAGRLPVERDAFYNVVQPLGAPA